MPITRYIRVLFCPGHQEEPAGKIHLLVGGNCANTFSCSLRGGGPSKLTINTLHKVLFADLAQKLAFFPCWKSDLFWSGGLKSVFFGPGRQKSFISSNWSIHGVKLNAIGPVKVPLLNTEPNLAIVSLGVTVQLVHRLILQSLFLLESSSNAASGFCNHFGC